VHIRDAKGSRTLRISCLVLDSEKQVASRLGFNKIWGGMSKYAHVVMFRSNISQKRIRLYGPKYEEILVPGSRLSRAQLFQRLFAALFGDNGPSILLNLEGLVDSAFLLLRHLRALLRSDFIVSYEFWFAVLAAYLPGIKQRVIYRDGGAEWARFQMHTASTLVKLKYGVLGVRTYNRIRVIALSEFNKSLMISAGVDPDRISVFRHGRVDQTVFHPIRPKPKTNVLRFLFVGRIVPEKGVHVLLEAADIIINKLQIYNVKFEVVGPAVGWDYTGSSDYYESIVSGISARKLDAYFELRPFTEAAELALVYSQSDVLVLPSLVDAYPSVVAEAMMCGIPVIGTNSGGMSEMIISGENGLLVEPNNSVALADAISVFIREPELTYIMGSAALRYAHKHFSLNGASEELLSAIIGKYDERY
jgi:glycosyltransferase involved in cell wall biosynthesis